MMSVLGIALKKNLLELFFQASGSNLAVRSIQYLQAYNS